MKFILILLMLTNMGVSKVQAQIDSVFWFAAPWVTPDHDGNVQMAFRISTFGSPATVRIQQPAATYDTTFVIPANSLADVPVSHLVNILESTPEDMVLTNGMKITSDALITVVYDFISDMITISPGNPNNPETYSLKGQNGMGTEFVTPFQTLWWNQVQGTDRNGDGVITQPKQYFSVVATEDNTTIYIKPNCDVEGHPADITYSVVLPLAGNVYTCQNAVMTTNVPGSSLSGSIVSSDKPVSVTINDDSVRTGGGGCYDLQGDQIVPTDVIGNEYIVNIGFLFAGSDESIFIIPAENFTTITVTDAGGATTQLANQGETWQYSITDPLTHVISDKPVYLVHMSGYGCETGLAILPPLNCAGSDEVSFARNNAQQFLLNILVETADVGNFTFTGPGTATVPAAAFAPVPGTGGAWMGAQIDYSVAEIPVGTQNTITNSSGFFSLGVINGGPSSGCLYHYLSSFHRKVITDAGADLTLCDATPAVDLTGSVTGGTITGIWEILDGTGTLNNPTNQVTTYDPSPSDISQGSLTFVLSSTGNCEPVTDTMMVTFIQSPQVGAGLDDSYCENNIGGPIPINGSVLFASGASWAGGNGGAFGNPGSLSTTYTPSPADIAQDSVILYLTSAGSLFACPDDQDTVVIYFTEAPTVLPGSDLVVCSNTGILNLNGIVTGVAPSGEWSTSGTGAFSPSSLNPITDYLVSSGDTLAGSIYLTLTSTSLGCLDVLDSIQITFLDEPIVNIISSDTICANNSFIDLEGLISSGYTPTWSTTGFGSIVSPGALITQYGITAVDTSNGFVDFYLSSNAGICPTEQDSIRVYFIDPPSVNAGPDQAFCNNEIVQLNGSVSGVSTQGNWSTLGTGTFMPGSNFVITGYQPSPADLSNGSVNLILTSPSVFGCAPSIDNITISFLSSPIGDYNFTIACDGSNTVFTDQSTVSGSTISTWDWDFGDNGFSIVQDPQHTYPGAGNYIATLIAGSNNGCFDTIVQTITVNPVPVANFSPTVACEDTPIDFIDLTYISSGNIVSWLYDFGGDTSTDQNPTYIFGNTGIQMVTLTVTSDLGCVDDTSMVLTVNAAPNAEFSFTPNPALVEEAVIFTDESTGNQISGWYWDFGDNEGDNAQNPWHNYSDGGDFEIILIVTDAIGCQDTATHIISIALPPVLPTGFSPNGDNENDIFIIRGGPFKDVDFKVYNNWGELVFSSTEQSNGWDGTYKGVPAPLGVYTWTFVVTLANDLVIKESGDVTLIR
ncbi:MAG: PKD domain-containing protein [Crocinitomicaceae bacterium]|nr:PKD domain-containing protein [Crocinitomicaceae bacterium]